MYTNLQLWQAFAGVKKRRVENYYQNLLAADSLGNDIEQEQMQHADEKGSRTDPLAVAEKWKGQIEKVSNCLILHYLVSSISS